MPQLLVSRVARSHPRRETCLAALEDPVPVTEFESYDLPIIHGHADGIGHAHNLLEDEQERLARELAEQLARKRPPGFAPWPETAATGPQA